MNPLVAYVTAYAFLIGPIGFRTYTTRILKCLNYKHNTAKEKIIYNF